MGNYILFAIPVFFILIALEWWIGKRQNKKYYRFNDTITNLNIGIGNQVFSLLLNGIIVGGMIMMYNEYAFFELTGAFEWIACLFLYDMLFYWAHRWGHEINFFWGAHVVHHQSEDYNLGVALRQSWFHGLIGAVIFLPIPLLGFEPKVFLTILGIDTLYQFWIHTEAINKLPRWFEFIFNTPSHHRVHHAKDKKYLDKNYGGIFIFWDRIFGTFMEEEERPTYGTVKRFDSWNPTWANFQYYSEMLKMMRKADTFTDKIKVIFARPGWTPSNMKNYEVPTETDNEKYDQKNPSLGIYITIQFIVIIFGLLAYMTHFSELSLFYKLSFATLIILSTMICGAIMEKKPWLKVVEYGRLLIALALFNTLYYYFYIDWFYITLIITTISFLSFITWFTLILSLKPTKL